MCELGDPDACLQGRANLENVRITPRTSFACTRGGLGDCPLYQRVIGMHPEKKKLIEDARREFITTGNHGQLFVELFRKEKVRGGDALPKEIAELAQSLAGIRRPASSLVSGGSAPLPVPEVNSGTFTPGFGAPTPKRPRG